MQKASETPWWVFLGLGGLLWWKFSTSDGERDESDGQQRATIPGLYDRDVSPNNPAFADATSEDLAAVTARTPALGRMAVVILDAKGTFNDDEEVAQGAFSGLRSLYELLWLNKTFSYLFPDAAFAPTLGAYLDGFLNDKEWGAIVRRLKSLPKYV